MDPKMVSVIVPFYNTPKYLLDRCIESIINQKNGNFECIIVDDGSKQDYASFLNEYERKDKRIRILHKENGGLGSARNYGIKASKGEYVFFCDSDDYISPYALETSLEIALKSGADIVVGALKHVTENEKPLFKSSCCRTVVIESRQEKEEYILHLTGVKQSPFVLEYGQIGPSACAKLIKKEILDVVQFETDKYWDEDNLWNVQAVEPSKKIVVVDSMWYAYVIYSNSMVRGYAGNRIYEFQHRAKQEYLMIKNFWPECMQGAYYQIWDGMLRYCRTDTFQKANPHSVADKYKSFCKAIDFDEFREAMHCIDFNSENRALFRFVKNLLRSLLNMKNKLLAYAFLAVCIRIIKY